MPLDPVESIIHDSIADIRDEPAPDVPDDIPAEPDAPAADADVPIVADPAAKPDAKTPPADKVDHVAAAAAASKKKDEPAAPVPPTEDDDFSKVPERDAQGRINRIPHTRVAKMVEVGGRKAVEEFKTKEHAPVIEANRVYEGRLKEIEKVEHAMFEDKPRFVEMLKSIPGYTELLTSVFGGGAAKPAAAGAVGAGDDPEPGPDVKDAAGNAVGYSEDGLKALRAWDRRQAVKDAEDRLGKRIEPFERTAKDREAAATQVATINAQLEAATKWEGFVEHADAITKAMEADRLDAIRTGTAPKLRNLLDAYMAVVPAKLKASAAAIREQVMAELASAPRSTAAGGGTVSRPAASALQPGEDPVEKAIRDSIKNLPR